jgi:hypothetical protein
VHHRFPLVPETYLSMTHGTPAHSDYNTFVMVFADSGVDGTFRASYSTSGHAHGPWT